MKTAFVITFVVALTPAFMKADPRSPAGPRLREIVTENYPNGNVLIGATTGSWAFGQNQGALMDREFSYVTPENDFKQSIIHPDPDTWSWSRSDPWKQHIIDNRQILRMHGPVSPQCSRWAKGDSRTADELERNMREFVTALCRRYNGQAVLEEHHDLRCDFNLDRQVDIIDLAYLTSRWLEEVSIFEPVDLHADEQIDMVDYAVFSQHWLMRQIP